MKTPFREELKNLLQPQTGWCVSLYMPTHATTIGGPEDRTRLKNLLRHAREQLAQTGLGDSAISYLLAPADQLVVDDSFWRQPAAGLAIFISEQVTRTFQFHVAFEEAVSVARRFMLRPLLPILSENERFYVLALSRNQARLWAGTRFSLHEVDVKQMPHSAEEALQLDTVGRENRWHTVSPSAGRGTVAVFHGEPQAIDDLKDQMRRYFHQIDHALKRALPHDHIPLVIAAVEYLHPLYREVNTYPYLMAQGIRGNPDDLDESELLREAWTIVEPQFQQAQAKALVDFRRYEGTARASTQLEQIVRAAHSGRVESLFVAAGEQRWGIYDAALDRVTVSAQAAPGDDELLDLCAMQTLAANGQVFVLPTERMPSSLPIAAVYRW